MFIDVAKREFCCQITNYFKKKKLKKHRKFKKKMI